MIIVSVRLLGARLTFYQTLAEATESMLSGVAVAESFSLHNKLSPLLHSLHPDIERLFHDPLILLKCTFPSP